MYSQREIEVRLTSILNYHRVNPLITSLHVQDTPYYFDYTCISVFNMSYQITGTMFPCSKGKEKAKHMAVVVQHWKHLHTNVLLKR